MAVPTFFLVNARSGDTLPDLGTPQESLPYPSVLQNNQSSSSRDLPQNSTRINGNSNEDHHNLDSDINDVLNMQGADDDAEAFGASSLNNTRSPQNSEKLARMTQNHWGSNGYMAHSDFSQTDQQSSGSNSGVEWNSTGSNVESNAIAGASPMNLSTTWGAAPLGTPSVPNATMSDITNKQSTLSNVNSSSITSVWQGNEPGDTGKNSWNSPNLSSTSAGVVNTSAAPSSSSQNTKNNSSPFTANGSQGSDKENAPLTLPERTPLDNMIYRDGWGQVEIKQETPWAVPESPPPVNDDPSVWKPKANTGTEVWEKNTGHRTQPWQNQGPNTPRWMSDDHEPNSSGWGTGAPASAQIPGGMRSAGGIGMGMSGGGGMMGGNGVSGSGDGMLSNGGMNGSGSQSNRPSWNTSGGAGSGGSGASSGGNISPTNNSWSEDTNWSDWRDPSARGKEIDDGTRHWGASGGETSHSSQLGQRPSNGPYGSSAGMGSGMSERNKMQEMPSAYQQKPRGWSDSGSGGYGNSGSSQLHQRGGGGGGGGDRPDWNDENEWRSPESEKTSQWGAGGRERQQRPYSPPNGAAKFNREDIYNSKQYQTLLGMGFKREEIDTAMRNSNMNYEATLADLHQLRRRQQMQVQQQQGGPSSNAGFAAMGDGSFGKTGLPGSGVGGASSSGVPGSMHQQGQNNLMQQGNKPSQSRQPPVNIQAMAQQLSMAARQGIISHRLLNQPLAPQTVFLLHKLMGMHRQYSQSQAAHQEISKQTTLNPAMQQQQLMHLMNQVQQAKKDIGLIQKQIDTIQNEFMKNPMDPRFQGGPTINDLASSISAPVGGGFDWPGTNTNANASAGMPGAGYNQNTWRMHEPSSYSMGGGAAGDWGAGNTPMGGPNTFGGQNAFAAGNPPVNNMMWNADLHSWNGGAGGAGGLMGWRPAGPGGHGGMDEWSMKGLGGHGQSMVGDRGSMSPSRSSGGNQAGGASSGGYGMDEADASWGNNRQNDPGSSSSFSFSRWESLPEFEPGKPWRGSQVISADEDPHLTPGSVAKSPLLNAVTSSGSGHYSGNDQ